MKLLAKAKSRRRGAILSMELVLVLPIFLMLIFAIIEFSMLMSARTRISDPGRHGSRLLSISGCSQEEIQHTVSGMLGPTLSQQCQIDVYPATTSGGVGNVHIRVPMKNASPDLLWMTGFSVRNRYLEADAPMVMEQQVASHQLDRL